MLWAEELIINATENIIYRKDHFLLRIKRGQIRFKSFDRKISRITIKGDVVIITGNESIAPASGPKAKPCHPAKGSLRRDASSRCPRVPARGNATHSAR
jgi:hypothetical protein